MTVSGVSHACLLIELGLICISMAASLHLKSCEDHSLLKSYSGGLWKKHLQVWALNKKIRPVLLDTLAAIYVTCYMFLIFCFDFSKSYNDFSLKKSPYF